MLCCRNTIRLGGLSSCRTRQHREATMPATWMQMKRMLAVATVSLSLGAADGALADGTAWFTADQVAQGSWEYSQRCSTCHGAQLQGHGRACAQGPGVQPPMERKDAEGSVHLCAPADAARQRGLAERAGVRRHRGLHPCAERAAQREREVHTRARRWIACSLCRTRSHPPPRPPLQGRPPGSAS